MNACAASSAASAATARPDDPSGDPCARPWIVAIEASTTVTSVALADRQGRLMAQRWIDGPRAASQRLLPDLDALMREFGIAPGQAGPASQAGAAGAVAAVAVAHGPGGFTGLRVALTLAKTVARAGGARRYGFSTLEAMAARWPGAGDMICPALDARRGEVYGGAYRIGASGERPALLLADAVETAESLAGRLAKLLATLATDARDACDARDAHDARAGQERPRIWLGGSGARRYRDVLATALGDAAGWIPAQLGDPAADSLALLGAAALRAGDPGVDPLAVAPVYLRPSDAEKRHGIDVTAPVLLPEGAGAS